MDFEQITWKFKIAGKINENEHWIDEVSKLRAEELYDRGTRPAFKLPNGEFYDQDEFETRSHHILAYDEEKLMGAVRLLPVSPPDYSCISSKVAGKEHFIYILNTLFKNKNRMLEINRLVVSKKYQHLRIGIYLSAASFYLAEKLDYFIFANSNIHLLRSYHLKHAGGVLFPEHSGPYSSDFYKDKEIYLIYIDKKFMSPYFLRQIKRIKSIIPLEAFGIKEEAEILY